MRALDLDDTRVVSTSRMRRVDGMKDKLRKEKVEKMGTPLKIRSNTCTCSDVDEGLVGIYTQWPRREITCRIQLTDYR